VIAKIYADTAKILADPGFREQYVTRQCSKRWQHAEEFAAYLKRIPALDG